MLVTKPLSVIVLTTTDAQKEECTWVSLTSYSAVGNSRKSTRISLIDTSKEIHPKATPTKRYLNGMVRCHTPCRPTSLLKRRKRRWASCRRKNGLLWSRWCRSELRSAV